MKRYCSIKLRAELQKQHPDVLKVSLRVFGAAGPVASIAIPPRLRICSTQSDIGSERQDCSSRKDNSRQLTNDCLQACFLISLEEEAEIFQMQAQVFEFLQVEGQTDAAGAYKIAQDRVYACWDALTLVVLGSTYNPMFVQARSLDHVRQGSAYGLGARCR